MAVTAKAGVTRADMVVITREATATEVMTTMATTMTTTAVTVTLADTIIPAIIMVNTTTPIHNTRKSKTNRKKTNEKPVVMRALAKEESEI